MSAEVSSMLKIDLRMLRRDIYNNRKYFYLDFLLFYFKNHLLTSLARRDLHSRKALSSTFKSGIPFISNVRRASSTSRTCVQSVLRVVLIRPFRRQPSDVTFQAPIYLESHHTSF